MCGFCTNKLPSVEQIMEVADSRFLQQFNIQMIVSSVFCLMSRHVLLPLGVSNISLDFHIIGLSTIFIGNHSSPCKCLFRYI